ncbi:hypothetical protein OVA14_07090 [Agrococcus sp. SL85]|uniref:hypothetical protein n=1 Tax=Agrococcus sp. SL85 TaxID=2995141 RepID=UPI00226D1ECF|nr:hypothetical protein [Agrococcus sp. SL85]WAC65158.1 hypothetical protein OVA14_07090 [Agrococcus sp. SL85]
MNDQTPRPDFDAIVAERTQLKAIADDAATRIKQIDDQLRDLGYGSHPYAGVRVSIEHNRRLDADRFQRAYPPATHAALYKVTVAPDLTAIKEQIAPADLDAFYNEGTPKVVVR